MSTKLPAAPMSFYTPSLETLKSVLEAQNGASKGRVTLLTDAPVSIESAWNEVGASYDSNGVYDRGQNVVGHGLIGTISDILVGPLEPGSTETGYKLQFGAVNNIPIYIDGSGITTATIIGVALIKGVDSFAAGKNTDVTYIITKTPIVVTDGASINLEEFEIIIGFSEEEA